MDFLETVFKGIVGILIVLLTFLFVLLIRVITLAIKFVLPAFIGVVGILYLVERLAL